MSFPHLFFFANIFLNLLMLLLVFFMFLNTNYIVVRIQPLFFKNLLNFLNIKNNNIPEGS